MPIVNVVFDLLATQEYHRATMAAIGHAARAAGVPVDVAVVPTAEAGERLLGRSGAGGTLGDGVVIGPGAPYDDPEAAEAVVRTARERGVPLVGT